jgi:hypothetical protein
MIGAEYISTSQAAQILDVSQGWVAALCRVGSLEAARGPGKGSPWVIKKSSVDKLAAERADGVDQETLEAVADAIAGDQKARDLAEAKAEESFMERVVAIAKRYALGASLVVAGVVAKCVFPENAIGIELVVEGIREFGKSKR